MKLSITLTNNSNKSIRGFQIRAIGHAPLDLSYLGSGPIGPQQQLGSCVIWTASETLLAGQEIMIECETYSKQNFILVDSSNGAELQGGDNMGTTYKLDIKNGDRVTFVDASLNIYNSYCRH
jgi:hypothetical protein